MAVDSGYTIVILVQVQNKSIIASILNAHSIKNKWFQAQIVFCMWTVFQIQVVFQVKMVF